MTRKYIDEDRFVWKAGDTRVVGRTSNYVEPTAPRKQLTLARDGMPIQTHLPFTLVGHPVPRGSRPVAWPRPAPRASEAHVGETLVDSSSDEADDSAEQAHTTVMAALYPLDPSQLLVDGGDPPEQLHVTIAFLGESADIEQPALDAARASTATCAVQTSQFDVSVAGCGTLGPQGAVVLFLEAQELNDLCDNFWSTLDAADYGEQHEGFLPHLTIGYGIDLSAGLPLIGTTITMSTLSLVNAGERDDYELGADTVTTTDENAPEQLSEAVYVDDAGDAASGAAAVYVDDSGEAVTGKSDTTAHVQLASPNEPIVVEDISAPEGAMAFQGLLVVEGVESGDQRLITEQALTWRELPLPLMVMFENPDGGAGHAGAKIAGRIDSMWRHEDRPNEIWGSGEYDDSEPGREAYRMLQAQMLRGVSVDLDNVDIEWEQSGDESDDPLEQMFGDPGRMIVTSARIMGATQCGFPAFAEAHLEVPDVAIVAAAGAGDAAYMPEMIVHTLLDTHGALVASAGNAYPLAPPASWFERPELDAASPVRVDADGRVWGHVAAFGTCHIGFAERCVDVPHSATAYSSFRTGQVLTADGTLVATGPICTDTVHPDLALRASDAAAFYADSGCAVADVVAGEDQYGIWVAGAVRPGATGEQVRALRGGDVSPDWRSVKGRLEVVAMLAVNNGGFKVPVALAASAGDNAIIPGERARGRMELGSGKVLALVAAGHIPRHQSDIDLRLDRLSHEMSELSSTVKVLRADRARMLRSRLRSNG